MLLHIFSLILSSLTKNIITKVKLISPKNRRLGNRLELSYLVSTPLIIAISINWNPFPSCLSLLHNSKFLFYIFFRQDRLTHSEAFHEKAILFLHLLNTNEFQDTIFPRIVSSVAWFPQQKFSLLGRKLKFAATIWFFTISKLKKEIDY